MSKIRELIEQELLEMGIHDDVMCREAIAISIESTIKAEIMGLKPIKYLGNGSTSANGKYNKNLHPMTLVSVEDQHIDRSDLENLFKESE